MLGKSIFRRATDTGILPQVKRRRMCVSMRSQCERMRWHATVCGCMPSYAYYITTIILLILVII